MGKHIIDLAQQVYKIIRSHSNGTIAYSDVCKRLTGKWANLEPDSVLLAEALGSIVDRCRVAGLPALSAVVVHKNGDKMPGRGYFVAAHGNPIAKRAAWRQELRMVHATAYPMTLEDLDLA